MFDINWLWDAILDVPAAAGIGSRCVRTVWQVGALNGSSKMMKFGAGLSVTVTSDSACGIQVDNVPQQVSLSCKAALHFRCVAHLGASKSGTPRLACDFRVIVFVVCWFLESNLRSTNSYTWYPNKDVLQNGANCPTSRHGVRCILLSQS